MAADAQRKGKQQSRRRIGGIEEFVRYLSRQPTTQLLAGEVPVRSNE